MGIILDTAHPMTEMGRKLQPDLVPSNYNISLICFVFNHRQVETIVEIICIKRTLFVKTSSPSIF
jgi:hypothetical protein